MSRLLNLKRIFSIMNPFQIDPNMLDWKNAEKAAPYFNWLAFLDVVATQCTTEYHFNFHADGDKYCTVDYWRLVLYQHDSTLEYKRACNSLNQEMFMAQGLSDHAYPIGGVYERYSRLVPNESQVNQFMRAMPKKLKRNLSYILLEMQLKEALRLGIIDKFIEVYLDDHHEYYYGSDRSTNNPTIIGTNKGKGTNRMRNLCAVMIGSKGVSLFAGCFFEQKQVDHVPAIEDMLKMLKDWGFEVKRVFADRGFTSYDLISAMNDLGLHYTGSIKRAGKLKAVVEAYLNGTSPPVVEFELVAPQSARRKGSPIHVMLIMKTHPHCRVRDIRRAYRDGTLTIADAMKSLHIFITTEPALMIIASGQNGDYD